MHTSEKNEGSRIRIGCSRILRVNKPSACREIARRRSRRRSTSGPLCAVSQIGRQVGARDTALRSIYLGADTQARLRLHGLRSPRFLTRAYESATPPSLLHPLVRGEATAGLVRFPSHQRFIIRCSGYVSGRALFVQTSGRPGSSANTNLVFWVDLHPSACATKEPSFFVCPGKVETLGATQRPRSLRCRAMSPASRSRRNSSNVPICFFSSSAVEWSGSPGMRTAFGDTPSFAAQRFAAARRLASCALVARTSATSATAAFSAARSARTWHPWEHEAPNGFPTEKKLRPQEQEAKAETLFVFTVVVSRVFVACASLPEFLFETSSSLGFRDVRRCQEGSRSISIHKEMFLYRDRRLSKFFDGGQGSLTGSYRLQGGYLFRDHRPAHSIRLDL